MKRCSNCGKQFTDENDFCPDDGSRLPTQSVAFDTPTQVIQTPVSGSFQHTPKPASPMLYLVIGVFGAGFIAAMIFIFAMPGRNDEAKNSEQANSATDKPHTNATPSQPTNATPSEPIANPAVTVPSPPPVDPALTPAGAWSGDWTHDKNTSAFTARAELQETGGRVEGRIVWTLVRSTNPQKMYKSGLTAVEFVRGTFDPATRLVKVRGYRKDDPNNLVIYDAYNLSLSADKQSLFGRSKNGNFRLGR